MFRSNNLPLDRRASLRFAYWLSVCTVFMTSANGESPQSPVSVSSGGDSTPASVSPPKYSQPAVSMSTLELQGIAKPKRDAVLHAPTSGLLSKVHVEEGQRVRAGDELITLDDRVAKAAETVAQISAQSDAAIRQASVAHQEALEILKRTQIAFQNKASSTFELAAKRSRAEQTKAEVELQVQIRDAAIARWKLAIAQRESLTLRAPFDGEVIEIRAESGNSTSPNEPLIRIAQLDELRAEMHLPLRHFGQLEPGQSVTLRAGAPVNRTVSAVVGFVSPVIEPTSESFRVVLQVPNTSKQIPAGTQLWFDEKQTRQTQGAFQTVSATK